jgi:3-phenylpropionate/trans-cinnamate dioxygenase ferredoxin component
MDQFVTLGNVNDVPPKAIRAFDLDDVTIAVANIEGTWYAVDDTCSHRGCSLAEGELDGTTVLCRCHFGQFDLATGKVLSGPPPTPVESFEVQIVDDQIQVRSKPA